MVLLSSKAQSRALCMSPSHLSNATCLNLKQDHALCKVCLRNLHQVTPMLPQMLAEDIRDQHQPFQEKPGRFCIQIQINVCKAAPQSYRCSGKIIY